MRLGFLFAAILWLAATSFPQAAAPALNLMPWPAELQPGSGEFPVNSSLQLVLSGATDAHLQAAAQRFLSHLSGETGIPFTGPGNSGAGNFLVQCKSPGSALPQLGEDESYSLEVTPSEVRLTANKPVGVMRGFATFLQLVRIAPQGFVAPAVTIRDRPRFAWRGLLIDVSRHFMTVEDVERNLDAMEALKFNVLHLHLSDNQGFRVESRKFPKFQQLASDGKYYTQAQVRELIAYAADRGIRIVPEFDMPGHATSWFAAYPELASAPGPYQIERKWGVFDPAIDPTKESTYRFLDAFIGEMAKLFPDPYFHIGGDEVNGRQWDANAAIQAFMRAHALKNNAALQAYFNQRLEKILTRHGKKMMGWDEILDPSLPKDIVIQSWRGPDSLAAAARQGYSGLLSNGYYLDLMQPASEHYLVDPLSGAAAQLSEAEKQRILGGEACMWAEMITPENLDGRVWPRAAAIAERLWSPASVRDLTSMYARLAAVDQELQFFSLKDRSNRQLMLERMTGGANTRSLRALLEVLEPVKEYTRSSTGNYTSSTPLNRLVDAAPPESDKVREFAALVDRFLKAKGNDPGDAQIMAQWLAAWRDNDERLEPTLSRSALLAEVAPLSRDLRMVAAIGLQALASQSGEPVPGWREAQFKLLDEAAAPKAELLNMIVAPVRKLVEAMPAH